MTEERGLPLRLSAQLGRKAGEKSIPGDGLVSTLRDSLAY